MSCFKGTDESKANAQAEQVLHEAKKTDAQLKTLLLGAGDSGKTTILKQLKIIHQTGYTQTERLAFKDVIYMNVIKNIKTLIQAASTLNIPIEMEENITLAKEIGDITAEAFTVCDIWTEEMGTKISQVFNDPGIQKAFAKRSDFQIDDSTEYLMLNLHRISQRNYVPTDDDVLRCRLKTSGIIEMTIKLKTRSVQMIDVGGQRNERKKWMHCFDGVTAVIYVASLSEYDQLCFEDGSTNRMTESLKLFDSVCNKWFTKTPIIIFFNKSDVFQNKILKTDLKVLYPEYTGGCNYNNALNFIKSKYLDVDQQKRKSMYSHITCATDTNIMKKVFSSITDIILQQALVDSGLA